MTNLNKVIVAGNLTSDSTYKETNGLRVCTFSIAVNRTFKKDNETITDVVYINNMAIFDIRAEKLGPYLKQGVKVIVEGHLTMNTWEKDGVKNSELTIKPDFLEIVRFPKDLSNEKIECILEDKETSIPGQLDWDIF